MFKFDIWELDDSGPNDPEMAAAMLQTSEKPTQKPWWKIW